MFKNGVISFTKLCGGGGGVLVKHLVCGPGDRGSSPFLATMISEIGYLPLPSRDMTEITLKRRKILNQSTNEAVHTFKLHTLKLVRGQRCKPVKGRL